MTRKVNGLSWVAVASMCALLVAAMAWLAIASQAQAGVTSLGIESKTAAPGAQVTVALTAQATAPGIGSYGVNVVYDGTKLTTNDASCSSSHGGVCTVNLVGQNTVHISGSTATATGFTGAVTLGSITFTVGASASGTANLDVQVGAGDLTDPSAVEITGVVPTDGAITIQTATPSPSPSPSPSASPAPSPSALPKTGGDPASDGSSVSPWLLAALGLSVVGAGMWVVSRVRRESP